MQSNMPHGTHGGLDRVQSGGNDRTRWRGRKILNEVIHSLIYSAFYDLPIIFSSGDHLTAQFHINPTLWFNVTRQLSPSDTFFLRHSKTLWVTAKRDVAKRCTRKSWSKHDLSIWWGRPQKPHASFKRHRWELCRPAEESTVEDRSFLVCDISPM